MARWFPELLAGIGKLGITGMDSVTQLGARLQVQMKTAGNSDEAAGNLKNWMEKIGSGDMVKAYKDAGIEIYLGYVETGVARLGRYVVDEITVSGLPDTIVIKGKASDMRGSGKTIRSGSWENVLLSKIVADIAARNGWQPGCHPPGRQPLAVPSGRSQHARQGGHQTPRQEGRQARGGVSEQR